MAKKSTERVEIIRPTIVNGESVIPQRDEKSGKVKAEVREVSHRDAVILEASKKARRLEKPKDEAGNTTQNAPTARSG